MLFVLLQPGLRGEAGRERGLDALEHDVQRTGQPADLGRLLCAGHALVEVACRDGVRRRLDVLEGAQAEPDEPPPARQSQHERDGRHRELGQEQRVQRALLVDDGLGVHSQVAAENPALDLRDLHPEGGPPGAMNRR